jgi:ribosomal protein S18 acetylase RimI-like enzyme
MPDSTNRENLPMARSGRAEEGGLTPADADITYRRGNGLDVDQTIALYRASTLGERRPVDDRACMAEMLSRANLVISAWDGDKLVGIARTLTDFCYVAYLADLAVDRAYQRQGIGRQLVDQTQAALGPGALIVLLAAPAAAEYYPHIGFTHHPQAWILHPSSHVL